MYGQGGGYSGPAYGEAYGKSYGKSNDPKKQEPKESKYRTKYPKSPKKENDKQSKGTENSDNDNCACFKEPKGDRVHPMEITSGVSLQFEFDDRFIVFWQKQLKQMVEEKYRNKLCAVAFKKDSPEYKKFKQMMAHVQKVHNEKLVVFECDCKLHPVTIDTC